MVVEFPAIDELKREYRLTYAEYVRQVDVVERLGLSGEPDSREMETAMMALERARRAYSAARDQLAEASCHRRA